MTNPVPNNMNEERVRLNTFTNWPMGRGPMDPNRIAKAGFFYTGNDFKVQCYWCNSKISEWNFGEQIMAKHRRLDSRCPFIVNPFTAGNVPIGDQPTVSEVVPIDDLMNEQCRIDTFKNWPVSFITPQALAKAGFYYFNKADQVRCAWCKGVVGKWEIGDNPFKEHQRFFPTCPRVILGPNIEVASNGIRDLGIQHVNVPKKERYASLDARVRSFANWPCGDIQHPEILSIAGFYYENIDDQVRCFYCNGGLRLWKKEDDAWYEHAKWFPTCEFVQLVKGSDYISTVQGRGITLEEAMESTVVQNVLQMGLNAGRVRMAVKNKLERTGQRFLSTEGLIEHVFDIQHEENDEHSSNNTNSNNNNNNSSSNDEDNIDDHRCVGISFGGSSSGSSGTARIHNSRYTRPFGYVRPIGGTTGTTTTTTTPTTLTTPTTPTTTNDYNFRTSNMLTNRRTTPITTTQSLQPPIFNRSTVIQSPRTSTRQPLSSGGDKIKVPKCDQVNKSSTMLQQKSGIAEENTDHTQLEEENRKLKDARTCKICMDEEVGVVFLPCGHLVTCVQCAVGITLCPLCRCAIKGFVRTFLS